MFVCRWPNRSRVPQQHRSFSLHPACRRRVYIIGDATNQLHCTPSPDDKLRTELRTRSIQVSREDRPTPRPSFLRQSPSWICVDGAQLDLRRQYAGGARNQHVQGLVGLMLKEGARTVDQFRPFAPSLPSPSQIHSSLDISANGRQEELELLVRAKPKPPTSEECCMSGCAHCVYDIYLEELTAYKAAIRNFKQNVQALGVPESMSISMQHGLSPIHEHIAEEDIDPTTKAFLELERKLKNKSKGSLGAG